MKTKITILSVLLLFVTSSSWAAVMFPFAGLVSSKSTVKLELAWTPTNINLFANGVQLNNGSVTENIPVIENVVALSVADPIRSTIGESCAIFRITKIIANDNGLTNFIPNPNVLTTIYSEMLELNINNNNLAIIVASVFPKLESFYCNNNNLSNLDLSNCPQLKQLRCADNNLTSLNVSGCTALNYMIADGQTITVTNSGGTYKNPIDYKPKTGTENIQIGTQTYPKDAILPTPPSGNTLEFTTNIITSHTESTAFSGTLTLQGYTPPVNIAVTGVDITPSSLSLTVGGGMGTLTANVTPTNATNKNVTWESSNVSVAVVSSSGVVAPVAAGTAIITVKTVDGNKTAFCSVTVTASGVSNEHISGASFAAYPNPTSGMVTVTGLASGKTIHIYSAIGTLVGTYTAQEEEMTLDLSNLSKGLYFINAEGQTIRIIKN